jgi:DNA gyrase subunit A
MATNIPPHNLNELVAGICALVDNPDITNKGLMKFVKGPDFPTGGIICGDEGIKSTYETGKGALPIRSKVSIEEFKKDRQAIIVHEIPYQVNKASLIVRIAELVQEKKITGISDLRDESGRQGMRIFIEIKKGVNPSIVLNQLFKLSSLQTSFNCNMLALIDGEPKLCNLKTLLEEFVKFRFEVITRRTKYDLRKAEERAHILEGILIALDNLDEVIKLIRGSKDAEAARTGLMKSFKMSEIQAQAILDIRLQRLTAMESLKIREEHKEVMALIKELKEILGSKKKISELIKTESQKLAEDHGDARRTEIQGAVTEVNVEELIPQDEVAVFITLQGYVKRLPVQTFRAQMRGGRGITGMATRDTDVIEKIYVCSTHSTLMCFTNLGKACGFKVYDIPDASRQSKGQHLANLLELADGETVSSAIAIEKFDPKQFLMMATKQGVIKKTQLSEFETNRKSGIIDPDVYPPYPKAQ